MDSVIKLQCAKNFTFIIFSIFVSLKKLKLLFFCVRFDLIKNMIFEVLFFLIYRVSQI